MPTITDVVIPARLVAEYDDANLEHCRALARHLRADEFFDAEISAWRGRGGHLSPSLTMEEHGRGYPNTLLPLAQVRCEAWEASNRAYHRLGKATEAMTNHVRAALGLLPVVTFVDA